MQRSILVFALIVSCSFAAPLEKPKDQPSNPTDQTSKPAGLIRPSPINPDIPSDPKPQEKITLITDPKVLPLASSTTEATKLTGPFVLPREALLRTKRETKTSSESNESSSSSEEEEEKEKKPSSSPLAASHASSIEKSDNKPSTTVAPHVNSSTQQNYVTISGAIAPSTPTTTPTRPRIPYAPEIHQHNEHLFKPTSTTLTSSSNHVNDKRDIPVPLTRKLHHSDEADDENKPKDEQSTPSSSTSSSPSPSKVPKEETKQEEAKDGGHKTEPVDQHPAAFARPIPVAELFAKKPSTE